MTRKFNRRIRCRHCGGFTEDESPFGGWLRQQPTLDSKLHSITASDFDWVIHCYRETADRIGSRDLQHMMIVETKTRCSDKDMTDPDPGDSQIDTMWKLDQVTRDRQERLPRYAGQWTAGSQFRSQVVKCSRDGRRVNLIFYGIHVLRMSGECPATSHMMTWDKKVITEQQIVKLFRFDLNPDSLLPINVRRHKPGHKTKQLFS